MTTIAHISDIHFGRIAHGVVEPLVEDLFSQRPDLVVISGDLTQRARPAQFRAARDFINRLPIPQIIVPGNHDVPLYDLFRRFTNPYGRFRHFITTDEYPEFENDDVHVVGINTATRLAPRLMGFWKDGKIREAHLQALKSVLTPDRAMAGVVDHQQQAERVRILVAHHPFLEPPSGSRHGIIHGAARALPVLQQLKIDFILSGHIHLSYCGDVRQQHPTVTRPMFNILAGSATSVRARESHNAYYLLRISGRTAALQRRVFEGGAWRDFDASKVLSLE